MSGPSKGETSAGASGGGSRDAKDSSTSRIDGDGMLKVALVAINQPGYRSLALAYLRAYAGSDDRLSERVAFQTLDLDASSSPWLTAYRLARLDADLVAFSVMCWSATDIFETCRVFSEIDPGTRIVLGGPEVGPIAESVLAEQPWVDAIVRGEGEETFAELLLAVSTGRDLGEVAGVTARTRDGVVSAPDRPLIQDLDRIPSPYLTGVLGPIDGSTYLETYRGCQRKCAFCFEGKGYGKLRFFSDERVAAEIESITAASGVTSFSFIDPILNLTDRRLEWLASVLEPAAARGACLHTVEIDIERIGPSQARLLRRAGVVSVESGPQTIGREALERCRRSFDQDRFTASVAALKADGISVECDLIVGLPGDTCEDVLEGMSFLVSLDPGKIQCSTLRVLPGTEFWASAADLGLHFDGRAPHEVIRTPDIGFADLRRLELMGHVLQEEYATRLSSRRPAGARRPAGGSAPRRGLGPPQRTPARYPSMPRARPRAAFAWPIGEVRRRSSRGWDKKASSGSTTGTFDQLNPVMSPRATIPRSGRPSSLTSASWTMPAALRDLAAIGFVHLFTAGYCMEVPLGGRFGMLSRWMRTNRSAPLRFASSARSLFEMLATWLRRQRTTA